MELGKRIRELREEIGFTQGQVAGEAAVSQGYLSQLENGDVRNPSAAVILRLAQAIHVDPDDLFEAAGYPTVRTLKQVYEGYEANVDPDLLRFLTRLPRNRQRRLLLLLEGMEHLVEDTRRGVEDTRRGVEDTRRGVEDTRGSVEDTQRTVEDTRGGGEGTVGQDSRLSSQQR
jgi:transcriptional regulator with XRE-family HTH domain